MAESEAIERRRTPAGTFATKRTTTTYNPFVLLPHAVVEEGWATQTGDERCTRMDYVGTVTSDPSNPWAEIFILGVPSASTLYTGTGCSGAELRRSETAYDSGAYGAAPTKGNPTAMRSKTQASPVAWSETKTTYDALGRPKQVTDPNIRVTTTTYTPTTGYPAKTEVVNPKGHKTTTDWLVARQVPSKLTDPNGTPPTTPTTGSGGSPGCSSPPSRPTARRRGSSSTRSILARPSPRW